MTKIVAGSAVTVVFLSLGLVAAAQPGGRRPPPAAYEACEGKSEGASCSVDTPRGTLEGTCRIPPNMDELVCVPNDFGNRGPVDSTKPSGQLGVRVRGAAEVGAAAPRLPI